MTQALPPLAFTFASSGEAYDAVQCLDALSGNGHTLVCADGVVGLSDTWPVAVTANAGNLHTVSGGRDPAELMEAGQPLWSRAAIVQACAFALVNGQPLHERFAHFEAEARAVDAATLPQLVDAWASEVGA